MRERLYKLVQFLKFYMTSENGFKYLYKPTW